VDSFRDIGIYNYDKDELYLPQIGSKF